MIMDLPDTRNMPTPEHHGLLLPAAALGAAIGAIKAKNGQRNEGAIVGAAFGAVVAFGIQIALVSAGIGTYLYARNRFGPQAAHEALQQTLRTAQAAR